MTSQELNDRYIGRKTSEEKLNQYLDMEGKFGKAFIYTFSFQTNGYCISVELCVEHGCITGIVPDKEEQEDEWGYLPETPSLEIRPEEYDRIAKYLDCVTI